MVHDCHQNQVLLRALLRKFKRLGISCGGKRLFLLGDIVLSCPSSLHKDIIHNSNLNSVKPGELRRHLKASFMNKT